MEKLKANKDLQVGNIKRNSKEKFEDRTIFSLIEFLNLSIYFLYISTIPFSIFARKTYYDLSLPTIKERHFLKVSFTYGTVLRDVPK